MIRFTCKQCGKRHRQPDEAAGSLLFCSCGQANRVPWESTIDAASEEDEPRPRRTPRRRSDCCLNHHDVPASQTCADCGESFCPPCSIEFQGKTLCGPCKNLRVRKIQEKPKPTALAVVGLVVGLVSGPAAFCLTLMPVATQATPGAVLAVSFVGLVVPAAAVALSLWALREIERSPAKGGRSLAMTGAVCGIAGALWALTIAGLAINRLTAG